MKRNLWGVGLAMLTAGSSVQAMVIDEATFTYYGGSTADVPNSIKTGNDKLRAFSYEEPWLAVGNLGGCTATWLGDKDGWSYVLTAAHCFEYQAAETAVNMTLTLPNGVVAASGAGTAYVPKERIKIPPGMGGASTDIAILKLPLRKAMLNAAGRPVERPVLNDSLDEKGLDVIYVGYGTWGVGLNGSGDYLPAKGERRLYGRSRIDSIFERDYGISASYQPVGPSAFWARLAPGDSGSAWWQMRNLKPVIIATSNGMSDRMTTGARVAKYASWIKSIYPEVRFLSSEQPQGCIVSVANGARYCLPAGQSAGYSLPSWIIGQDVYVDAAPGTAVKLSDYDNLSYGRVAKFVGSVENASLKKIKADNGQMLDFSRPRSMSVIADATPLGCIVSLTSGTEYCLPGGQRAGYALPPRINGQEVQVQAAPGLAVKLSDYENLSYNRVATFPGVVQNWELRDVKAWDGQNHDFSRPRSMEVVQQ